MTKRFWTLVAVCLQWHWTQVRMSINACNPVVFWMTGNAIALDFQSVSYAPLDRWWMYSAHLMINGCHHTCRFVFTDSASSCCFQNIERKDSSFWPLIVSLPYVLINEDNPSLVTWSTQIPLLVNWYSNFILTALTLAFCCTTDFSSSEASLGVSKQK